MAASPSSNGSGVLSHPVVSPSTLLRSPTSRQSRCFSSASNPVPSRVSKDHNICRRVLKSKVFENGMGLLILMYFVTLIMETDMNARGEDTPTWIAVASISVLSVFAIELCMRLFVWRTQFFHDPWNVFDFVIVGSDVIASCAAHVLGNSIGLSAIRVARLSRLIRAAKILRAFPELRLMVAGLSRAVQSIFWGTVLMFVMLVIWSVAAVQFIHPLNEKLTDRGYYKECDRCPHAFESTFQSVLTFVQQIVTGDSWGQTSIPLITEFPLTAIYFMAVFLSVGLALLNLMLAVVVNVATDASESLRKELEEERWMASHRDIIDILADMDKDGSNELTKDELFKGYRENAAFRSLLESMEIVEEDLEIVWSHFDADKSGGVTPNEFAHQLCSMKGSSTQFIILYIKHYISNMKLLLTADLARLNTQINDSLKEDIANAEKEFEEDVRLVMQPVEDVMGITRNDIHVNRSSETCTENATFKDCDASHLFARLEDLLQQSLNSVNDMKTLRTAPLQHKCMSDTLTSSTTAGCPAVHILNPARREGNLCQLKLEGKDACATIVPLIADPARSVELGATRGAEVPTHAWRLHL